MWITRVSINNPVFATMVMVGLVVLGIFSYARLRVEQMPDVTLPYVLQLAKKGVERALAENKGLAEGLNVYNGKVTNPAVAETFGLECATM